MKGAIIPENVASPLCTHSQKTPGPVTETTYSAVSRALESDCKWNLAPMSAPSRDTPPKPPATPIQA